MNATGPITALLERYLDLHSRGEPIAIEELCRDTPELLTELRREIARAGLIESNQAETVFTVRKDDAVNGSAISAQPCGTVVGGYELLGELGRGGMGAVYRARQIRLNRLVALKLILAPAFQCPEGRARFRAEAAVIARLRHPNVVQIFEFCPQDHELYFSMELCDGGSLARRLRAEPLSPCEAAALIRSVTEGVQAAHDQGVIHRDLTPGNILLARRGDTSPKTEGPEGDLRPLAEFIPKISDFGLAKQINVDMTHSRVVLGTPQYMAPEQTVDARAVDPRADVYALGGILYQCLTGQPPFQADSLHDIFEQVRHREPVPVRQVQPSVPRDLETICLKCLSKEPQGRYATARELAEDLGRFLQGEPILARSRSPLERLARWCQRPERMPFAGRLAVVLYGSLAVWKLLALVLVALGIGIVPRDVGQCVLQVLALIALLNVPQIGIGIATLAHWPPAPWIGASLAFFHLVFVSVNLATSLLNFGGLLDDPNMRALVWCLLIVPGSITLPAYLVAIIAQRAGRRLSE